MVEVVSNFLPPEHFSNLTKIVHGNEFQYYFQRNSVGGAMEPLENFMFSHILYDDEAARSDWCTEFLPVLDKVDANNKKIFTKLLRMKLNLYTNQNKKIIHASHHDYSDRLNENIKIGLFNFTSCDGGTTIDGKDYQSNANEIILFDNKLKHNAIVQTNTPIRIVLNIVWQ